MEPDDKELNKLLHQLIEAENTRKREIAEPILAQNFTAITRSRGEEQNRDAMLNEIENPKNPNAFREILEDSTSIWKSGDLSVVRSLFAMRDKTDPQAVLRRFRNMHVFEKQQGHWQCIAWQVTELK
jgi:Domain of unknown function (DUF4440)